MRLCQAKEDFRHKAKEMLDFFRVCNYPDRVQFLNSNLTLRKNLHVPAAAYLHNYMYLQKMHYELL